MPIASLLRVLVLLVACVTTVAAQCAPQWQPGDPIREMVGSVTASASWDPDGAGPALPVLVVGGSFTVQTFQGKIATFDGTQWAPLGNVPASSVSALAVYGGDLVAAGSDPASPGSSKVWRWDGTSWLPLGAPGSINGGVAAMAAFNGWLVVGGSFLSIDGLTVNSVAKWDGATWSRLGSSFVTGVVGSVKAFAVFNGELHVAGNLTQAAGINVNHHAVFNGAAWAPGAVFDGPIETLAVRIPLTIGSSYLFAGGAFTTVFNQASGTVAASHVARLQTTGVWSAVGAGLAGAKCVRLCVRATSLVGYELMAAVDTSPSAMWKWVSSTSTWTSAGQIADTGEFPEVTTISLFANEYVLGLLSADSAMRSFASSYWGMPLATQGFDGTVVAQCRMGTDTVIGGSFQSISGVPMNGIARGHANAWQPLGGGVTGGFGDVYAVASLPNGDVIAAGNFASAGGVPATNIARWNGTTWAPLGNGLGIGGSQSVYALCVMPNGDVIAGGYFSGSGLMPAPNIARWNGSAWSWMGAPDNFVNALTVLPNGDLVAGGSFTTMGAGFLNYIARWNGTSWSSFGNGLNNSVWAVVGLPDGSVVAGGRFTYAGFTPTPHCARWNGTAWQSLQSFGFQPTSDVVCLEVLPDGDVVAGGEEWTYTSTFPPAQVRTNLARLDLSGGVPVWSSLDVHGSYVQSVQVLPDGSLSAAGGFTFAGSQISGNVARLVPPCPALATTSGVGCSGRTLTALTLPWVESTFRAKGTGLPTNALVLTVTSVTSVPSGVAPLSAIFAQGQPGCDVLVVPDILGLLVTTNGTATSSMFLPNTPPLVGVTFFHQMIPIAIDAQGAWTSVTATNALQLTAGMF